MLFSPRMWRCFWQRINFFRLHQIFSTYVEVFLFVPFCKMIFEIFSTYVEVFLSRVLIIETIFNFLHVCGGVSNWFSDLPAEVRFSPRMWRCFLSEKQHSGSSMIFSTYVEVFLNRQCTPSQKSDFLHVCGGVSPPVERVVAVTEFSPRMWRCFFKDDCDIHTIIIFSTYVEVFLRLMSVVKTRWNFLHVCGGVSAFQPSVLDSQRFSPRMWRCFYPEIEDLYFGTIFSTYVEVFPTHCK